jgi:hypothetical protein
MPHKPKQGKGTRITRGPKRGDLRYTTKRGDKVFHIRGHDVARHRNPFMVEAKR